MDVDGRRTAGIVGAVAAITAAAGVLAAPISRDQSHLGRAVLAGLGIALVGLRGSIPARLRPAYLALLAALCTLGWFNYWQFDPKVAGGINDYTDTAYYYTNSKYLGELGYDGLYAGALLCDDERGAPRTRQITTIRDLRDDELVSREVGLEHGREVKALFTPERWAAFCHDMTFFLDRIDRRALTTNFFVDHGYNPPPTWTIVGGNLSELVRVEDLKRICNVDTALVGLMLLVVGWGFGLETMLWGSLFYTVTFSGRWPILGMAIMRFDWVAALVAGYAFLRRDAMAAAGASMTYAALNRVFPAIFFWGWLVEAARDVVRERRVPARHLRFAGAAAITATLMTGVAAVQYGPGTLAESAHHLSLHNESFSSHRVGLATVLVYRGETTREQINANGGMRTKELAVQAMMPALRVLAVGFLALIAVYGWRTGKPAWELVPLVTLPLFCATTPQVNYYNYRLVLVAWHASRLDERAHRLLLALLLGVEVVAQGAHFGGIDRFSVNAWGSIALLVYFSVLTGFVVLGMRRAPPKE